MIKGFAIRELGLGQWGAPARQSVEELALCLRRGLKSAVVAAEKEDG